MPTIRTRTLLAAVAVLLVAVYLTVGSPLYLRCTPDFVASRLLVATPIGSPQQSVLQHLRERRLVPNGPYQSKIEPGYSYPPTDVHGEYWLRVLLGEYGLLFTTSVEAFYVFDASGQLVGVSIRKTTDAL
jgi:hypothetical protein